MRYFLDFDRTLFNTDLFIPYLFEHPEAKPLPLEVLEEGILSLVGDDRALFEPHQLAPFVYADVPETLRALGNEASILTFGNESFQRTKIENALAGIPRISALYTDGVLKGEFLKKNRYLWSGEALVVDDSPFQLENIEIHCPDVRLFEIRRDGKEGDGRWPVIHSLTELPLV